VHGIVVKDFFIREFYDLAQVHDRHSVGNVLHYGKIVGYEQVSEVELILKILQKVYHLGLDGDIQRRNRFIADYELGV
jgi:hypothetical protein